MVPALCWLLAASGPPARASDENQGQDNARLVVNLFLKSCVQFQGDRDGLRAWATKSGLPELHNAAADAFLYGLPGAVYDATSKGTRLVLISEENGSCSTFAQFANGPAVLQELERILIDSRVKLTVTGDRPDRKENKLQHREYTASGAKQEWQMLVSTVDDPAGGEAMLTANPW